MIQLLEILQLLRCQSALFLEQKTCCIFFLLMICEFHMVTLGITVQWLEVEQFTINPSAATGWFLS